MIFTKLVEYVGWPTQRTLGQVRLGENLCLILRRGDDVGERWRGDEEILLAHDESGGVEAGEFEAVAVGDGVSGACLHAIAAEDAAVVVDVVDLGVTLGAGDAFSSVFSAASM